MSHYDKFLDTVGKVEGVYLVNTSGTIASSPVDQLELTLDGLVGDRHFGATMSGDSRTPWYTRGTPVRNYRQVSIISVEDMDEIAAKMGIPRILPEWLGANLLVSGIPNVTLLPPSARLFFGETCVITVDGINLPCHLPANIIQANHPDVPGLATAFPKVALRLRGTVGWVERPGFIRVGDACRVLIKTQEPYEG